MDELELIPGETHFHDFGGVFTKLPIGAVFASHVTESGYGSGYTYDPFFDLSVQIWVVKVGKPDVPWKMVSIVKGDA